MSLGNGIARISLLLLTLALSLSVLDAQEQILDTEWTSVETENFTLISQLSARQTLRYANLLESWRRVAAFTISGVNSYPAERIPQYVYLFDDASDYQQFTYTNETGFFTPTPRANFMAIVDSDPGSVSVAFHYYVHFLVRNFADLRLPRWYEEGLAGYISRMQIDGDRVEYEPLAAADHELIVSLSETLSMERLLFREDALASPRVIQIANLKSETLLYFLHHASEETGFADRRPQLQRYLQLLLEDRNPRFAYDQAFDLTPAQLDTEFHSYLALNRRSSSTIPAATSQGDSIYESKAQEQGPLAILLAELALNSGRFEMAQLFFQWAQDAGQEMARSYSGVGDAIRMQELEGADQDVARYFELALALAPNDPNILLDFGEYWETELADCEKVWPPVQQNQIVADMRQSFLRALELQPDNPEANLAMGQLYLLPGLDWQSGEVYQRRAFELLPADTFILEQSAKYAIAAGNYAEAELLINELAQPIHNWGEPEWVTDLRTRLLSKRNGESYDACEAD